MAKASGGTRSTNSSTAHKASDASVNPVEAAREYRAQARRQAEDIHKQASQAKENAYDEISAKSNEMKASGANINAIKAYRKEAYKAADNAYDKAIAKADKLEQDAEDAYQKAKLKNR